MIIHPFEPVYNENSSILILGTFPSVKSRENEFYYGHPQNRFWKVLASIFNQSIPSSITDKKAFLLKNRIALWDTIASCKIEGSADSSITDVTPNDINLILNNSAVQRIYCNGTKAFDLYKKYILPQTAVSAVKLPSTSPANAAWTLEKLITEWKKISVEP